MKDKKKKIKVTRIIFEMFEIDHHQGKDEFKGFNGEKIEKTKAFLKKHKSIQSVSLLGSFQSEIQTKNAHVLIQFMKKAYFDLKDASIIKIIESLGEFMKYTEIGENQDYWTKLLRDDYWKRFYTLSSSSEYGTLDEAIYSVMESGWINDNLSRVTNEISELNPYEENEFGDFSLKTYEEAALYNYVIYQWDNDTLAERISSFYFV
jgi:hypothetical protein